MQLIDNFYSIVKSETKGDETTFWVKMNANHGIYQSHFPNNPVTPGACLVQMSTEMLQLLSKKKLLLTNAKKIKFKQVVKPADSPRFTFKAIKVDEESLTASVIIDSEGSDFAKMTITCRILENKDESLGNLCVIIPTYNNATTIVRMIQDVSRYCRNIIVVSDGCTDETDDLIAKSGCQVELVTYKQNRGKGHAIVCGLRKAMEMGFTHAITMDADGQHFAEDIPLLVAGMKANDDAIIIGSRNLEEENMPRRSTFANKFSNFWFRLQTGTDLPDTQTGFRLYPLTNLCNLSLITSRYEGELALLVLSAWRGTEIVPISVRVYYPKKEERVSHFRPVYDFVRISILNTVLCVLALFYGWPKKLLKTIRRR